MRETNGLRDMFSMQLCTPKESTKFSGSIYLHTYVCIYVAVYY